MDSRILVESLLAYQAVYDEELRDAMEENGLIFGEATAPEVEPYEPRKRNPLPKEKPLSGEKGDGSGYGKPRPDGKDPLKTNSADYNRFKKGLPPKPRPFGRPFGKYDPDRIKLNDILKKLPPKGKNREIVRKNLNNSYDLYDIILSHLLDEGYAETVEAAESIMVNMSENWRESIFEEFEQLNEISDKKVAGLLRARDRRDIDTGAPTKEFFQRRDAQRAAARRNARTGSNVKVDPILSKP